MWHLLWFHVRFRIIFPIFMKNGIGIFIVIALNLQMAVGHMNILAILILHVHEHRISFHLFAYFSISFIHVLKVLLYRSFTSLVKFISLYFIVFDSIVNGIVFFQRDHCQCIEMPVQIIFIDLLQIADEPKKCFIFYIIYIFYISVIHLNSHRFHLSAVIPSIYVHCPSFQFSVFMCSGC